MRLGRERIGNRGYGAYAITIHKSQGSEFPAVVTPLAMQQYLLLQRNLVYNRCPGMAL